MKASFPTLLLLCASLLLGACEPGGSPLRLPDDFPDDPQPVRPEEPEEPDQPDFNVNVQTLSAEEVSSASALLQAAYSDASVAVRELGFEWGRSASALTEILQAERRSDAASASFEARLEGLGDGQTYYYRAYVILQDGDEISLPFLGEILSFTTPRQEEKPESGTTPAWAELPLMSLVQDGSYQASSSDPSQYYAWHLCSGGEKGPQGRTARNYTVCYSAQYHCPLWVAAPRHTMYVGDSGRSESYRVDPDIPANIQYASKSTGGGCNKGHMLGSAERTSSKETNRDVFYYTNIAPQLSSGFNTGGGGWNTLEDWVDGQVCADTLYEVVGCYFDSFTDGYGVSQSPSVISFGSRDDVSMPTMFYYVLLRTKKGTSGKAVKDCAASELKCAAFVRSHSNSLKGQKVSRAEMMSVAELERITGFRYFANVPNAPKDRMDPADWGL